MNDMDYELANIIEVIGFLEDNNIEKEIPITFFDGLVKYKSPKVDIKGKAEIRISLKGYMSEGTIEISGNDFEPTYVHTQFTAKFQTYKYDKKGKKLVIYGNSDKMQGNYVVTISV
jgi:hypothetical protein